jgi:hypothetical protein
MRGVAKPLLAAALAALLAAVLAACGGGGSEDSTAGSTATSTQSTPAPTTPEGDGSSKEGSASFRTPGGDNSIQNFGDEAGPAEVEAATAVLATYMRARASDDWAGQCAHLAKVAIAPLEQLASNSPRLKGKGCAAILAALSAGTRSTRANTMTDGVTSLRVAGDRGFALYHGAKGVNYFVPMVEEGGEWKLGALAPSEFP